MRFSSCIFVSFLLVLLSCKNDPKPQETVAITDSEIQTAILESADSTGQAEPTENPFADRPDFHVVDTSYSRNSDGYIELTWHHLKKVDWTERFNEEVNAYIAYPDFHPDVLFLNGKRVQISGYVIPTEETNDETLIVLSAFPYSNCFFCGGAGPESVMDIQLNKKHGSWAMDDRVTFRGALRLNDSDLYYLNYILEDAEPVE